MNKDKTGLLTIILICFFNIDTYAQEPDYCYRFAVFGECTIDDSIYNKEYKYSYVHYDMYCAFFKSCLSGLMSRERFRFLAPDGINKQRKQKNTTGQIYRQKPTIIPKHVYSFDVNFVSGLKEFRDNGRPIYSSLTISMYFEGEQRELVHCWKTQGSWDTILKSRTSWMKHGYELEKCYKNGPNIYEIIKDFEKVPASCMVNPEKEEVNLNETIDIELFDFRDVFGETSREFNRIIVHANSGEILNGEEQYIDFKVFMLNYGTITVKYKVANDCKANKDTITIYSSCNILPINRSTLGCSDIYKLVGERTIGIKR